MLTMALQEWHAKNSATDKVLQFLLISFPQVRDAYNLPVKQTSQRFQGLF